MIYLKKRNTFLYLAPMRAPIVRNSRKLIPEGEAGSFIQLTRENKWNPLTSDRPVKKK